MDQIFTYILCLAPTLMVASVVLPKAVVNRNKGFLVQFYKMLLFLVFTLSILGLFPYFSGFRDKPIEIFQIPISNHLEISISYFFTDMSVFLGILISFLGLVTLKYSERYLSGEENRGYFYKWMVITIGSILSFVSANNLIVFAISWSISSWGIHVLLTFYPERAAGNFSAWKKFYISRLGDLFLGIATVLCYMEFKTFQLDEIFSIIQSGNLSYTYTSSIGIFLAMGIS